MTAEAKVTDPRAFDRHASEPRPSDPHVFVSYSSKDRGVADAVLGALEAAGARCWIAPRDIRPGRDWGESIVEAIEGSRAMVLVFSGNANASPQVRREVERAVNKQVVIVPFRIENVPPCKSLEYFISVGHWLDAYADPLEQHLATLASTVVALGRGDGPGNGGSGAFAAGTAAASGFGASTFGAAVSTPAAAADGRVAAAARRHRAATAAGRHLGLPSPRRVGPALVGVAAVGAAVAGYVGFRGGPWPWAPPARAAAPAGLSGGAADDDDNNVPAGRGTRATASAAPPTVAAAPASAGWTPPVRPAAPLRSVSEILRSSGAAEVADMRLTSAAQIGAYRFCVIDGNTYREGGEVRGFVVHRIESDKVTLARNGLQFELRPQPKPPAEPGGLLPPEVLFGPRGGGGDGRGGGNAGGGSFGMPPREGDRPPSPQGGGPGRRPPGR